MDPQQIYILPPQLDKLINLLQNAGQYQRRYLSINSFSTYLSSIPAAYFEVVSSYLQSYVIEKHCDD